MDRREKQAQVEVLSQELGSFAAVFALDYRGLKVEDATEFRRKVRESGAKYRVVKNTLAKRVVEGGALESLGPHLEGMTGLAYTQTDPVALAKVINDFAKDVPALSFKAGLLSDTEISPVQFEALAALPSKGELQSQLLSVFQAPIQNFLGLLQAPVRDLLLVLKAAQQDKEKKEQGGD